MTRGWGTSRTAEWTGVRTDDKAPGPRIDLGQHDGRMGRGALAASRVRMKIIKGKKTKARGGRGVIGAARLAEMIEEATVDAYDECEQATGWFTMFENYLELPFESDVLGVRVTDRADRAARRQSHRCHMQTRQGNSGHRHRRSASSIAHVTRSAVDRGVPSLAGWTMKQGPPRRGTSRGTLEKLLADVDLRDAAN